MLNKTIKFELMLIFLRKKNTHFFLRKLSHIKLLLIESICLMQVFLIIIKLLFASSNNEN